jgi:hypothetical protein
VLWLSGIAANLPAIQFYQCRNSCCEYFIAAIITP